MLLLLWCESSLMLARRKATWSRSARSRTRPPPECEVWEEAAAACCPPKASRNIPSVSQEEEGEGEEGEDMVAVALVGSASSVQAARAQVQDWAGSVVTKITALPAPAASKIGPVAPWARSHLL